jgi:hypothetical protein
VFNSEPNAIEAAERLDLLKPATNVQLLGD